jgi:predicted chitinase
MKKGVQGITGKTQVKAGVWENYHVNQWYAGTPQEKRNEAHVKWAAYNITSGTPIKILEKDQGHFRFQPKAVGHKYLIVAYMYEPELSTGLEITVLPNEKPEILGVDLSDINDQPFAQPVQYGQTINCHARTVGMVGHHVVFALWEDNDTNSANNSDQSKHRLVSEKTTIVGSKGIAHAQFQAKPDFTKLSAAMSGTGSGKTQYYVTVFGLGMLKASAGTTPIYPDERKAATRDHLEGKQPKTEQVPPYKKKIILKEKGKIDIIKESGASSAYSLTKKVIEVSLRDENGNLITNTFSSKTMMVYIKSEGIINHKFQFKLYEEDYGSGHDILLNQEYTITGNDCKIMVHLDRIPRSRGGGLFEEGLQQEIYADVLVKDLKTHIYSKIVNVDASVFKVEVPENKSMITVKKPEEKKGKDNKCPNCDKPITAAELKQIFTKADNATLKKVSETYTKYMKELNMNTCWNKAHFFAQAVVETGLTLHVKNGESFNWYYKSLINTFRAFQTEEGKENAKKWGRAIQDREDPKAVDVTLENEKKIANWAYSSDFAKGKELGNTEANDGWDFRGKGLIQLTGRTAYTEANKYTIKENADILANPDLVTTDVSISVLSSMAFWKWKKIHKITNGKSDAKPISTLVGQNVRNSHGEKQKAFTDTTSKTFKVNDCDYGKVVKNEFTGKWHEPVINPISTLYMQSGGGGDLGKHWGLFGTTRNGSVHQGLDLFAELGTDVYSCVEGEVFQSKVHSGYGNTLTIKITDKEAFYNHRREYKLLYPNAGEIIQGEYFDKTEDIYLFYAHLQKVLVEKGKKVTAGMVIAKSGVSGVKTGTCAPHLHFEIFTTLYAVGKGLKYRCNPGYYVHFKSPTEQSKSDKELQKKTAENGKIEEFYGKK